MAGIEHKILIYGIELKIGMVGIERKIHFSLLYCSALFPTAFLAFIIFGGTDLTQTKVSSESDPGRCRECSIYREQKIGMTGIERKIHLSLLYCSALFPTAFLAFIIIFGATDLQRAVNRAEECKMAGIEQKIHFLLGRVFAEGGLSLC